MLLRCLINFKKRENNTAEPGDILCSVQPVFSFLLKAVIFTGTVLFVFNPARSFADIYRYKDENGVWHFTNIKTDTRYTLFIKEAREHPDLFINKYGIIIDQASEKFNLKPSLIKAIIKAESGFDHKAVSSKGAQGLMQLMPGTASEMDVSDSFDPEENIFGGTKYFSKLMERFQNDVKLALAAYNAGPDKVVEYEGIPPYKETKTFIQRVMKYFDQYEFGK